MSELINDDIAPVPFEKRTWGMWNIAALWVGMAVCIPTYMLAAGLISQGMTWWQALLTITLANVIVLIPMALNAHAGTKYGLPFPVLLRAPFGVYGANIPALMRGLVACGWFGIQTWIGGNAFYALFAIIFGYEPAVVGTGPIAGLTVGQFGCFLLFWAINIGIVVAGIDSVRWLEDLAAPFLIIVGLVLLGWGISQGGGLSKILSDEVVQKVRGDNTTGNFQFWTVFWPNLTGMVGFWATLSLNIPDFTRYARSQRDQVLGQLIGLPTTMALYSFIGIAVTCATVVVFGTAIWDPVVLLSKFKSPFVVAISIFALAVATLSTNIAANIVSPANDFAALWPSKITFRIGGVIAGIIGIVIMPWKLVTNLGDYIFVWLIGYGALLGAIGGVMLADYYVVRKAKLFVDDMYKSHGRYRYSGGFSWRALLALAIGIAPNVPGFLATVTKKTSYEIKVDPVWLELYTYAWFIGLFVAGLAYVAIHFVAPERDSMKPDGA